MLNWPNEAVLSDSSFSEWNHSGSNLCLDFHGDPVNAELIIFSDGNHHMALQEVLQHFCDKNPELKHVFYATTPPGPVLKLLKHGKLQIGNLVLSIKPDVFISPPHVLDNLVNEGYMQNHIPFMKNQGNVLLVKKGNPKQINGVADLTRKDIKIFLSNPETETVSYKGYVNTLTGIASDLGIDIEFLSEPVSDKIVYGKRIHHREAPQAVNDGDADTAIVYYHLALRYKRIFPSLFEIVPLGGTVENPRPVLKNVISLTHAGIIGDGGQWGTEFVSFLSSDTVCEIYANHGLLRIE